MALVAEYLNATTIHGLRYVAEARGSALARCLWLACIAASFAAAAFIIRGNIANWENSPKVITEAQPALIKVTSVNKFRGKVTR